MEHKTIKLDAQLHEKLSKQAKKMNMRINEYVELCLTYYIDENLDPRKPISVKEIRDTFVTFIRTQEKTYHVPNQNILSRMVKEIDAISHNVLAIKTKINSENSQK